MNLSVSNQELTLIVKGKKLTETVEIHPLDQSRFVHIDAEGGIVGIVPYNAIAFTSSTGSALVEVKGAKLYEVTNNHGDLLFYEYRGERQQQINLDYFLGEIIRTHNV